MKSLTRVGTSTSFGGGNNYSQRSLTKGKSGSKSKASIRDKVEGIEENIIAMKENLERHNTISVNEGKIEKTVRSH